MIERILLIDVENDRVQHSTSQLRSRWCHHPLGLLYLTAAVKKRFPDISIKIFHTITSDYPLDRIESLLTDYKPDLVGLRALSVAQAMFKRVAHRIHALAPALPLVGGGPYPSSSFEDIIVSHTADLVVIGEGENTFIDLIDYLRSHRDLPLSLPGTAVLENGELKVNAPQLPITDLNTLPFPDYEHIDLHDYVGLSNLSFQDTSKSVFICASRGCPYRCFYCHQLFGKKIRRRSPKNIVAEMRTHL